MSHTPHELPEEFPQYAEKISELRQSDAHFARLADEYHALNHKIHLAETHVEPTDEIHEAEMRKERLAIKDQIWHILQQD